MRIVSAVAVLLIAGPAAAQVPAGGEFTVNSYTTGNQRIDAVTPVAVDTRGNFVVTWQSGSQEGPGTNYGVFGQRFDAAGLRRGGEFHVNQWTTGRQGDSSVAVLGRRGRFVVTFGSDGPDGFGGSICARIYDGEGVPQTPEFLVNTFTFAEQSRPAVASDASGNFVVVWESELRDGDGLGVVGQRFGPAGNRLGAEFAVNTYTTDFQRSAAVAFTSTGEFVVTWASYGQDGSDYGLFAQRFDATGARLGGEFRVNTTTALAEGGDSHVAPLGDGGFVVVWDAALSDGSGYGVKAQRFDASGARVGAELMVNTFTTGVQFRPRAAVDTSGNFTVTWGSIGQEALRAAFAQRFDASGSRRGGEFRVSTGSSEQNYPGVGADPSGNFVIAWTGRGVDAPASLSAQAQRFGGLFPVALAVDTAGNGVLEPGESPDVRPSWRNVNGTTQIFSGNLLSITGPAGATYGLPDATANYGTVANGVTQPCTDCYVVSVSNPATRPVQHWDAVATEGIVPDAQGQRQSWRLHVGSSFTDVPAGSTFYRFVETLLHNGVTGGCSPTAYCPASSSTREQMAVFVLVAKEGAGYVPAPCLTPMFADVPASSPFCRWVEELARRGVVSGCGGGNYCPGQPVTREQMAIFVLRTLDPALEPPACPVDSMFDDVPASSPFCRWIEELARREVVSGCGGGNYCPTEAVSREQMGVFISATFGLTLYGV